MNQHTTPTDISAPVACAVDKSCADSGCGCGPASHGPGQRQGARAALFGVLCVLGCLAVPIAIGGFAALGGALSGEVWVLGAGLVVAAIVAVVVKRRGSGSMC